jgi:uncharacterized damage-inducible protein DinB
MIDIAYMRMMVRYNRWQNDNFYACAQMLDDAARRLDRGAFFSSIHGTLSHLVWADAIWLHRFAGTEKPPVGIAESSRMVENWDDLVARRLELDRAIVDWSGNIDPAWLGGELTWWSAAVNRQMTRPASMLVVHMFNHQTHHRGQVHAMLTSAGVMPKDTDLMLLSDAH